jgi:predicted small metal-binding protein
MKTFACKDMGMECDFVATGATAEEVTRKAMEHAQIVHGEMLKQMTSTPAKMAEMQQALAKSIK